MSQDPFESLPTISAGFRSPADDYREDRLDFNLYFRRSRPSAITEYRVKGDCMEGAYLPHNAIVIIDASIRPYSGAIVAAKVDGEQMIKQLVSTMDGEFLISAPIDGNRESIKIEKETVCQLWGVVTHAIIDLHYPVKTKA